MRVDGDNDIKLAEVRDNFHEAFHRVWHNNMENDGFNRLVLHSGLTARQVIVLRAYCKYLRQARIPFSQDYMEETLANNAAITARLVDLFEARFDPARSKTSDVDSQKCRSAILGALEDVANLDEDRIIRRYLNIIEATLRTNFYQPAADGGERAYCSFKLDSRNIDELPLPQPFREIFVYSPKVEGVHLRFGMVARGGLRWSDRREDFRTEVLGLVKAQQVKNAVIVPVGSKGGFVMKQPPPASADATPSWPRASRSYKTFIRGLLDITDNLVKGKLVPPKHVVRYDGDDPYLVVAADKGTATFSDIANSVSIDYGHWLDDAFASGGSAGYDHKKMGITARGAWECVKRHFRELGKDIQNEDFTCIGMRRHVAATSSATACCFPSTSSWSRPSTTCTSSSIPTRTRRPPGPSASASSRNAALGCGPTTNTKLISKGGGVFRRKAKSIKTTPRCAKRSSASQAAAVTPNEADQGHAEIQTDLLWFGGIGTYIKAAYRERSRCWRPRQRRPPHQRARGAAPRWSARARTWG